MATTGPRHGADTRRRATDAVVSSHARFLIDPFLICHVLSPATGRTVGEVRMTECRDRLWWPGIAGVVLSEDPDGHQVCHWCRYLTEDHDIRRQLVMFARPDCFMHISLYRIRDCVELTLPAADAPRRHWLEIVADPGLGWKS